MESYVTHCPRTVQNTPTFETHSTVRSARVGFAGQRTDFLRFQVIFQNITTLSLLSTANAPFSTTFHVYPAIPALFSRHREGTSPDDANSGGMGIVQHSIAEEAIPGPGVPKGIKLNAIN